MKLVVSKRKASLEHPKVKNRNQDFFLKGVPQQYWVNKDRGLRVPVTESEAQVLVKVKTEIA